MVRRRIHMLAGLVPVLLLLIAPGKSLAHEYPDTVRVKAGTTATFTVADAADCNATIWIDDIRDPDLFTINPMEGYGIEVEFTIQAAMTPGVTTIVVQWYGEHVGQDEGNCKEDTRDFGGFEIVIRVTPEFVNSIDDGDDLEPGDGHCDTGGNITRGSREEPNCPLRAAIQEANAVGGGEITFDIPGPAPYIIAPGSPLPPVEQPLIITGPLGAGKMVAAPEVTLDGRSAGGTADGLVVLSGGSGSKIENLIIFGFGANGIRVSAADVVILHCFIGTNESGSAGLGNKGSGILIDGPPTNTIGGEHEDNRNILSGNGRYGVEIKNSSQNRVLGNWIGLSPDSSQVVANEKGGVYVDGANNAVGARTDVPGKAPGNVISGNGSEGGVTVLGGENFVRGNVIGSTDAEPGIYANKGPGVVAEGSGTVIGGEEREANTIAGNDSTGVLVRGENSNISIRRNEIFRNSGLGIDLLPSGPTKNDSTDADTGANGLQNFPVIDSVNVADQPGSRVTVYGKVISVPGRAFEIDLFLSDECDESEYGQGEHYAQSGQATTGADGKGIFMISFVSEDELTYDSEKVLTLTATDLAGGTSEFSRCARRALRIVDFYDKILAEREFVFVKVDDDAPRLTETVLDTLTTDEDGLVYLEDLDIEHDEQIKVTRRLQAVKSVKRTYSPKNAYSVHIDNGTFSRSAALEYERIDTTKLVKTVKLDHTTIHYNMVVSVEWDALPVYLTNLERSFRLFANYMYDVTDGQVRFDTVAIYSNRGAWSTADARIYANNTEWPRATVLGFEKADYDAKMYLPRRWFGSEDRGRNLSVTESPLNLTHSSNYRTIAHEFGHYGFGLYDEYLYRNADGDFVADVTLKCPQVENTGFMQNQYSATDAASGMSWARQYPNSACRNTKQYATHSRSSWGYFEFRMEDTRDDIFAPIIQPAERSLPSGKDFFVGPNAFISSLDYDVGALVHFPVNNPATSRRDRLVRVLNWRNNALANAQVTQIFRQDARPRIVQGKTSDQGRLVVLGADNTDSYRAEGYYDVVQGLNKQEDEVGWYSGTLSGDSDEIVLNPVAGLNRAIVDGAIAPNGFALQLSTERQFPQAPSLEVITDAGQETLGYLSTSDGYSAAVALDSLRGGRLTTTAVDDSSRAFFFTSSFSQYDLKDQATPIELFGADGEVRIFIDSTAVELSRALVISTPYPPLRTGLPETAMQAGLAHSIRLDPPSESELSILIQYSDIQLPPEAAEASLRMHRWSEEMGWQSIGGAVDTVDNTVSAGAIGGGVFAAFTTSLGVSIESTGAEQPLHFELHPAYPNPFNPSATIPFDVAEPVHVRLEVFDILGRSVAVLVDESRPAGRYETVFDGGNLPSGLYFYRIRMGAFTDDRTMVLVK